MHRRRPILAGFLLVAQTGALLAAPLGAEYDAILTRYARGEATLGELQEARRSFQEISVEKAVARAPSTGDGAGGSLGGGAGTGDGGAVGAEDLEAAPRGETRERARGRATGRSTPAPPREEPGTLARIASWIRDIPRRFTRRWVPDDDGITNAAEGKRFIEESPVPAYTANAAQREADSDWTRPVRVTAKAEINRVQAVLERVIGFGGLATLAKALSGDGQAIRAVNAGSQAVARMTPSQRSALTRTLTGAGLKTKLASFIGGKPTTGFGKIVKDQFGNNMMLAVVASSMAGIFLNDGLDLDTLKDNLVALNAIEARRTHRENMIGVPLETIAFYHMDRAASKVFERLWSRVSSGSGGLATWLRTTETTVSRFGSTLVRNPPAHLAGKAAEFGRTASSFGLPGVTGATQLTLKGAAEGLFKAGTLGVIGIPLINGAWKVALGHPEGMVIGGNRGETFARYDLYDTYYQRTGNKVKDAVEERKWATLNFIEAHEKFPFTHFLNYFLRMAGGYVGAVVASSLVAPVSIPTFAVSLVVSAIFSEGGIAIGNWLGAKLDTSPAFYRRLRRKNAERVQELALDMPLDLPERRAAVQALAALDAERVRLGLRDDQQVARLFEAGGPTAARLAAYAADYRRAKARYHARVAVLSNQRADDYERLMKVSQVNDRIKFVHRFEDIRLYEEDGYVWVETPGFTGKASPRYDFITAEGRRGVWDYKTNRVLDVGFVREQNGRRIAFLDDDGVEVEGGSIQVPRDPEGAAGNVVVTDNGVIMEKGPKDEWLVRGYGGEYDVVLRGSGRRFAWDGERFAEVTSAAKAEATAKLQEDKDARTRRFEKELVAEVAEDSMGRVRSDEELVHDALRDLADLHRRRSRFGQLR